MKDFWCGCSSKVAGDHCATHEGWPCHLPLGIDLTVKEKCPPCYLASLPSTGLMPAISLLKYDRIKGHFPKKTKY